jgi:integrase
MPVVFAKDHSVWKDGCAYLASLAFDVAQGRTDIQTVQSAAWHLHAYLAFCEQENIDPVRFGTHEYEKPTYLYHGYLLRRARGKTSDGRISISTAAARMRSVVRFFKWRIRHNLTRAEDEPFQEKIVRTSTQLRPSAPSFVSTTDLVIKVRRVRSASVEGGLRPVSAELRDLLVRTARLECSEEFALMLEIGFRTGLRLRTIAGLTISALTGASPLPASTHGTLCLRVGPAVNIPTKYNTDYIAVLPPDLAARLIEYASSPRRLIRRRMADPAVRDLVFLTRSGQPYCRSGSDVSTAIAKEISRLKQRVPLRSKLRGFHFHSTRATFGTLFVLSALRAGHRADHVVSRLSDLMGHTDPASTFSYLKFVEQIGRNTAIDDSFSEATGSNNGR